MLVLALLASLLPSAAAIAGPKSVLIVQNKGGGHGEIGKADSSGGLIQ
jgi:hypothetical protein